VRLIAGALGWGRSSDNTLSRPQFIAALPDGSCVITDVDKRVKRVDRNGGVTTLVS
jgi:streptogramin lyase